LLKFNKTTTTTKIFKKRRGHLCPQIPLFCLSDESDVHQDHITDGQKKFYMTPLPLSGWGIDMASNIVNVELKESKKQQQKNNNKTSKLQDTQLHFCKVS
jgi:hypothetical protein